MLTAKSRITKVVGLLSLYPPQSITYTRWISTDFDLADFDFLTIYILMLSLYKTVQFHAEKFKSAFHLPPATHLHWHKPHLGLEVPLLIVLHFTLSFCSQHLSCFLWREAPNYWHSPTDQSPYTAVLKRTLRAEVPPPLIILVNLFDFFWHISMVWLRYNITLWNMIQVWGHICHNSSEFSNLSFDFSFSPSHTDTTSKTLTNYLFKWSLTPSSVCCPLVSMLLRNSSLSDQFALCIL